MKVVIVNTLDIGGGAARAAYRHHKGLLNCGVDSEMLVQEKNSDDSTVISLSSKFQNITKKIRTRINRLPVNLYKHRSKTLFSSSLLGLRGVVKKINSRNPDIVHLHWVTGGMMTIEDLEKIKAPIVWSLHDMWPFTGGCHYNEDCLGYENKCGNCKVLGSKKKNDISSKILIQKREVYDNKKNMTIVGLSNWIHQCSKSSTLFKYQKHINLPNSIDTTTFKPFDKSKARDIFKLPKNKKLILFGAVGATNDPRKGFKELCESLPYLSPQDKELVIFGNDKIQINSFGLKTHYLGSISNDSSLIKLFSAADLLIVPSLQENLSNIIMESLSCATPVVCFDIGGNKDLVRHKINGYLVKPFDASELGHGIEWILDSSSYDEICNNARQNIIQQFDSNIVSEKYIKLYKNILIEHERT